MDEVRLAVDMGYSILKIYEVYEQQVTTYETETRQGGVLADYIDTYLKLKTWSEQLPRLISKNYRRRAIYKIILEEWGDKARQRFYHG